jgi:hypothetical protein
MSANELNAYKFDTFQSKLGPTPATVASAATIAPTSLITYVTGTTQPATITPPLDGQHMLVLVFTDNAPPTFLTSGNVLNAIVPTQNLPTLLFYDPAQQKYFGGTMNLT